MAVDADVHHNEEQREHEDGQNDGHDQQVGDWWLRVINSSSVISDERGQDTSFWHRARSRCQRIDGAILAPVSEKQNEMIE